VDINICKVCGNEASQVFVNGHSARRYPLCEPHFKTVCSVRIVATQHVRRIKKINRRNVALEDEKYCGVRFVFLFSVTSKREHSKRKNGRVKNK